MENKYVYIITSDSQMSNNVRDTILGWLNVASGEVKEIDSRALDLLDNLSRDLLEPLAEFKNKIFDFEYKIFGLENKIDD